MPIKVLCIDDDPIAMLLSRLVLSKSGFSGVMVPLTNGKEAMDHLEKELAAKGGEPSEKMLILLDLNMPVMDGWEFLEQFSRKLYSHYHNTRIVLLSSSIDPEDIRRSKDFEMVLDFFPKPLTRDMLLSVLEQCGS